MHKLHSVSTTDDSSDEDMGEEYLSAKLHLVDLARSERAKRTGSDGLHLKEAPGNFFIWPSRLAKPSLDISKKTNIVTPPQPQLSPIEQLGVAVVTMGIKNIEIDMPPELTCKTATTTLFVCHRDICEIV
ncbi:hypothetical protein LR48_Vigan04g088500 [Vigna angularis]|uniref:Kinesin motor domain-containing protein n=1 Tax=Phaseolus angularis TaxID=3914 RepID=A0A0L9UDR3_PHAAN|nr:hypothetical protein LR48_Vigan04g088500 [Vigna angularis]